MSLLSFLCKLMPSWRCGPDARRGENDRSMTLVKTKTLKSCIMNTFTAGGIILVRYTSCADTHVLYK